MAHWRDSSRTVVLWMVDFRAAFPLLLFLVHIRLWTFLLAVVTMAFFGLIEKYGFTLAVFGRLVRSYIAGPHKISQPWWKR